MMVPLMIGTTELLLIGGIALLLFGGKKLPELMKSMGQGVKNFKEGLNEMTDPELEKKEETEKQLPEHKTNETGTSEVDGGRKNENE